MKENIMKAKGVKDYDGREARVLEKLREIIRQYYELYGFVPLDNPILERYETLGKKYSGGEEILEEIFSLRDRGNRKLALRFDLTVPLARYASEKKLRLPYKRYQISKVFRDGPVKKERLREFYQADADILGSEERESDAEILELFYMVFEDRRIGLKPEIKVNDRRILDKLMEKTEIKNRESIILTIDKLEKVGWSGVENELAEKRVNRKKIREIKDFIYIKGTNKEKLEKGEKLLGKEVFEDLRYIENILKKRNIEIKIDFSLARGLNYYTSTIFEVYSKVSKSSLAAGGRYDSLIESFSGKRIPAVGGSIGLTALVQSYKFPDIFRDDKKKVYVFSIGDLKERFLVTEKLRNSGIISDVDFKARGITKNLQYADYYGYGFCLIIGKRELKRGKLRLKDMKTGKESDLSLEEIIKFLKA